MFQTLNLGSCYKKGFVMLPLSHVACSVNQNNLKVIFDTHVNEEYANLARRICLILLMLMSIGAVFSD